MFLAGYSQKRLHFSTYTISVVSWFSFSLGFSRDHVEKVFSKSCRGKHIQGIRGILFNSRGAAYPRISPSFL
jgi:hypothetical protein